MKKIFALALAMLMVFAATSAFAADLKVMVNGEEVAFDQAPVYDGETLLLPLRFIAEKLGANVNWFGETQTIFTDIDGKIVTLQIGNSSLFADGDSVSLEKAPTLVNDRTLVTQDVFTQGLGVKVTVDEENSTILIEK